MTVDAASVFKEVLKYFGVMKVRILVLVNALAPQVFRPMLAVAS